MDRDKGFVLFDVFEIVLLKVVYVNLMKFGGFFYWMGVGDCEGGESLVEVGYRGFMVCYGSC